MNNYTTGAHTVQSSELPSGSAAGADRDAAYCGKTALRDVLLYRDLHRFLSRHCKAHISPAGFCVLNMIFDRTIGWGKLWECIPLKHFTKGVYSEEDVYSKGTGQSKRTVQRALEQLLAKGLILRRANTGYAAEYAFNFLWKPSEPVCAKYAQHFWQTTATAQSSRTVSIIQQDLRGYVNTN